jgi:hypothetical protein
MCDAGFYLAAAKQQENVGKTCSGGMYNTDAMKSMCIKCPTVGSCPRNGYSAGLFVPPDDGGTWLVDSDGACLLTGVQFVSCICNLFSLLGSGRSQKVLLHLAVCAVTVVTIALNF